MRPWRATGTNSVAIVLRLGVSIAALALLLLVTGCGPAADAPEEQLRQWVAAIETAAENKERGEVLELIASSYNDARGNTREDVDKLLRLYFLRQDRIVLLTSIDTMAVHGGTAATLDLTVGMAGTGGNAALGLTADAWRFELELEARDTPESYTDWQLYSARWGELGSPTR